MIFIFNSQRKNNHVFFFSSGQNDRAAATCARFQIQEEKPEINGRFAISFSGLSIGSALGSRDYVKLCVFLPKFCVKGVLCLRHNLSCLSSMGPDPAKHLSTCVALLKPTGLPLACLKSRVCLSALPA